MRRSLALAALLVVALSALVPSLESSHTVGHRYMVFGRLLGGDGMPAQRQEVTLKIVDRGESIASIITQTDCLGDFANWEGQPGNDPIGGGRIERNQNQEVGQYTAFHFHDPELSDRYDVQVIVGDETLTRDFHSRDRQTDVLGQLEATFPPAPDCDGFNEFNQTFTVRIAALNQAELSYRTEQTPKRRTVEAQLNDETINGTTDFNGAFRAFFRNVSVSAGDTLRIQMTDVGSRTVSIGGDEAKFRRADASYVLGGNPGGVLDDFRFLGVGVIIVAILIGLYVFGNKMRDRMAQRRLRETSTRRRFRREKQP